MEEEQMDVTQAETTAEASSAENETVETTQEATQEDSKTIPYDRFKEVIDSKKELERRLEEIESKITQTQTPQTPKPSNPQEEQVKQELKRYLEDLGYVSREELQRKEADQQVQQTIKDLSKKYDGSDGRPKFSKQKVLDFAQKNYIGDLEAAYKLMNEAQLQDWAIKQALGKSKGVKSEVSDGSGASNIGTTNTDLLNAASRGDKDALSTLIKRSL